MPLEDVLEQKEYFVNRKKLQTGFTVEKLCYYTGKYQELIGVEDYSGHYSLDNIGKNGENLTIAVLTDSELHLSIRLMNSVMYCIPNFNGEFLVGSNGLQESEKMILREHMIKCRNHAGCWNLMIVMKMDVRKISCFQKQEQIGSCL